MQMSTSFSPSSSLSGIRLTASVMILEASGSKKDSIVINSRYAHSNEHGSCASCTILYKPTSKKELEGYRTTV